MPHKRAKQSVREQQRKERGADLAPPGNNNGAGISAERIPKSAARVLDAARIRAEYRQKRARLQVEGADASHDHMGAPKPPPLKKRRTDAGAGVEKGRKFAKGKDRSVVDTIEIQPGESLRHFNRRVEDHMRPLVQSAMRASAATVRKERKATASSSNASLTKVSGKPEQQRQSSPSLSSNAHKKSKGSVKDASSYSTAQHDNDDGDDDRPKEFATTSSAAPRRLNDIAMAPPELKKLPRGATKHPSRGDGKAAKAGAAGVLSMAQRVMMEAERENAIKRYRDMKERKAKEGEGHVDGG